MRTSGLRIPRAALLAALAFLLCAGSASAQDLQGSLLSGSSWPARGIVLWNVTGQQLNSGNVSVTENGKPVSGKTVTSLSSPQPGDFGVEVVLDTSQRMSGSPIVQEMQAVRSLAAQRAGNQQLGIVSYSSTPSVMLPLTGDASEISGAADRSPWLSAGARVLPALSLATQQLTSAHVAAGAVILISDGAVPESDGSLTPASVAAAAHAAGIRIFTIGVHDDNSTATQMHELLTLAGGSVVQTSPAQLSQTVSGVWSFLTRGYVIRYHSSAGLGQKVTVDLRVPGASGLATASYLTPTPQSSAATLTSTQPAQHPAKPSGAASKSTHTATVRTRPAASTPTTTTPAPSTAKKRSFWRSSGSPLLIGLVIACLLALSIALLVVPRSKQPVQRRVENFIAPATAPAPAGAGIVEEEDDSLNKVLSRGAWWPEFVENVEVGRIQRSPADVVKLGALIALVAAILLTILLGTWLIVLGVIAVFPFALRYYARYAAKRQRIKFSDQLPSHLQDLAGAMRAGRSLIGAIAAVAEMADEPIRSELERSLADESLGKPLEETLEEIAKRMQSEDFEQVALVAALNRRSGSNVAEALDRVADGSRARSDMRREMAALTGQARISSWVLTGLPPVLLVAMKVIDPTYVRPLFSTTIGIIVLVFCAILVVSGRFVMNKIVNVNV